MHTKYLKSAFLLAGAVMAAPHAFADQSPSIIKVGKGNWTVKKVCPENDGKCKIYETAPKYSSLKDITTPELMELKQEGSTFTFSPNRNYWIVFYPKNTRVAVKLEFAASDSPATKSTLKVTGTFGMGMWTKDPQCDFSSPSARAVFVREYFAKPNPVSPCLTLTGAEPAKDTSAGLSPEEKSLRQFEMAKRKAMGLTAPDPLGSAPEGPSDYAIAPTARDYWRLGLPTNESDWDLVKKQYRKMQLAFHPDKNPGGDREKAEEINKRIVGAYERIKTKLGK